MSKNCAFWSHSSKCTSPGTYVLPYTSQSIEEQDVIVCLSRMRAECRSWKVMEFIVHIFHAWKITEIQPNKNGCCILSAYSETDWNEKHWTCWDVTRSRGLAWTLGHVSWAATTWLEGEMKSLLFFMSCMEWLVMTGVVLCSDRNNWYCWVNVAELLSWRS